MANYRIAELDFDEIKTNLKNFLTNYRDKDNNLIFKDYDFTASSLNILLDILSYNTHYNAYLANMVANEMFLDSAVKRESAVSIAKHLGYTPLSYTSARAKVTFEVPDPVGTPTTLTLPKFSTFTTEIDGTTFSFSNLDAVTIKPVNGVYRFQEVTIVEGEPLSYTYRVDKSGPAEKYLIPNKNVDTTTIRVTVQNSYTDLKQTTYFLAENLENLTDSSLVYFLEENPAGYYEIFFGDNILGKKLISGNLVKIEYLVSNGSLGNVSENLTQEFALQNTIGGVTLPSTIVAIQNSSGGDEADTLEEIKFKAPRFLSSFNRAVTASDYKSIIEANYPLVESVAVWGGEENDPPVYGKVYISLKPYYGYAINSDLKEKIKTEILANKKMMSIVPEFVDPNYLFITVESKIKYEPKNAKYTASEIENLVKVEIQNYFSEELQKFNQPFIYSKMSKRIDSIDESIIGNVSSFRIHKRISPVLNAQTSYSGNNALKYANKLISGTIVSSAFFYEIDDVIFLVYMKDRLTSSSTSTISLYDAYNNTVIEADVATVNYNTGIIDIPALTVAGYFLNSSDIKIYSKIDELDIQSSRDLILLTDESTLNTQLKQYAGLVINVVNA